MDELDMHRRCTATPADKDPEFQQWLKDNPTAQQRAKDAAHFDQQVRFALQQVKVPEGLDERILLNTDFKARRQPQRKLWLSLAAVASLMLAISLSWRQPEPVQGQFAQLALNHVQEEIHHLEHADSSVSQSQLKAMFQQVGAELNGDLGEVQFAFMCPTPLGEALHLIVNTASGQASLIYLPENSSSVVPSQLADGRFHVQTQGAGTQGALALIAERPEALQLLDQRIRQGVRWQTYAQGYKPHLQAV